MSASAGIVSTPLSIAEHAYHFLSYRVSPINASANAEVLAVYTLASRSGLASLAA
jgi:hypothetical protein